MKTILLIDDNLEIQENIVEILQLANYKVFTAENGKVGYEVIQQNKPDLILCDIMMPVLDGYGLLHLLNKNEETASIPFIFLTAKTERNDLRKGMELGADDYLTKPFGSFELINAIESRLKKSEVLKKEVTKELSASNNLYTKVKDIEDWIKKLNNQKIKIYKKKEIIYQEGNSPNVLYFIIRGKVKIYRINEYGKEFITGLYKQGDFIGYLALLEEQPYTDAAACLEETEICFIPKEDFFALLYSNTTVTKKFFKILSDNLCEKEQQLLQLAYNSVRKRVAEALLMLQSRYNTDKGEHFDISISREDLAHMAGTSTESVIRTLSDFRDENVIAINGSHIKLTDSTKLSRMKN